MSATVLPAFLRFSQEAAIIGRLLAGYGEVEFDLCNCLEAAIAPRIDDPDVAVRTLFRFHGEKQRIDTADALMRNRYIKAGLREEYCESIIATNWCRRIRNQYAHCHWWDDPKRGLYFTDLEHGAKSEGEVMIRFLHIDVPLLEKQETFFKYAVDCLTFSYKELRKRDGQLKDHSWRFPTKQEKPRLYNPPEKHGIPELTLSP